MNKDKLKELLKDEILYEYYDSKSFFIDEVIINLQDSRPDSLVFYKLYDNKKSIETFIERSKGRRPGLLITTKKIKDYLGSIIVVAEENFLKVQQKVCDVLYPIDKSFKIIGVTGTNGKTSVVHFLSQMSNSLGTNHISIGTLGAYKNQKKLKDFGLTSPSFIDLRKVIHQNQDEISAVFMEVSSHALEQERVKGLMFDCAIWTSFSQDHLDYHKTEEEYFLSKSKIFNHLKESAQLIVSSREPELIERLKENKREVMVSKELNDKTYESMGPVFKAVYNRSNLELSLEAYFQTFKSRVEATEIEFTAPDGRFNILEHQGRYFIVDFAHTPEALRNILKSLKASWPGKKVLTIFGCGGNRDSSKRPLMGKIASDLSDRVILTSDNPRYESPEKILEDIESGMEKKSSYQSIENRKDAILEGLSKKEFDIVLIAGKGHETYQEKNGVKVEFSDFKVIEEWIKNELC